MTLYCPTIKILKKWSGIPESNRRGQLGKLEHNHFANPACWSYNITLSGKKSSQIPKKVIKKAQNGMFCAYIHDS